MTGTEPHFEHDKYDELCALATAGVLTPAESEQLFTHLNECAECSEIFAQYQHIATDGMDFLQSQYAVPKVVEAFDQESALEKLIEATNVPRRQVVTMSSDQAKAGQWRMLVHGLIAASLVLGVAGGAYWAGLRSKKQPVHEASAAPNPIFARLAAQKLQLQKSIADDNQRISVLERQVAESKDEAERLRSDVNTSASDLAIATAAMSDEKTQSSVQIGALTRDRDNAAAQLRDAQSRYQIVQDELTSLRDQHRQDLLRMASLDERVTTMTASLNDQSKKLNTDETYLSSDRDIRDLIGARNLYIADIMDVDEQGESRKPFGRIFYTKTKSLIFYAYDLDQQPGVRRTSTFQVWGRTGSGDRKPLNLGVLYMDSESNRRWTLRVDDPKQLAQLEAVFVTIEPRPQADRPTGKPFLVASLRREPNHP
ncbi:MAG TPA: hypothetical protein VGI45_28870 [Terracidiphilus sp.]|jgi:hypothetical protein